MNLLLQTIILIIAFTLMILFAVKMVHGNDSVLFQRCAARLVFLDRIEIECRSEE